MSERVSSNDLWPGADVAAPAVSHEKGSLMSSTTVASIKPYTRTCSPGITERHRRQCSLSTGGQRCSCTPSFQAKAFDAKAGRCKPKTFKRESEAKRWRSEAQAQLRSGEMTSDRGARLDDYAEAWLADLRSGVIRNRSGDVYKPSAVAGYRRALTLRVLPVLGSMRLNDVTTKHVQELVDDLVRRGFEAATIDSSVTPAKALYRRAVARGDARVNPTIGIAKPAVRSKAKRIVAASDAEAMIAALDPNERPLWATAFYAGLRRGELIGLRREDVDLAAGVLRVERGWDLVEGEIAPKSRQGKRKVPVSGILRDHLDEHLLGDIDDLHVFGTPNWISRTTERARKRWETVGLPVLVLHEARHNYASFAIAAGLNAKTISTYMGHANISITLDLYGHLMPGNEEEAADLFDAYFARTLKPTIAPTVAQPAQVAP